MGDVARLAPASALPNGARANQMVLLMLISDAARTISYSLSRAFLGWDEHSCGNHARRATWGAVHRGCGRRRGQSAVPHFRSMLY